MKNTNVFFTPFRTIMLSCFFFLLFLLSTSVVSIFHSLILVNNELDLLNGDNLYLSLQSEDNPTLLPDTEDTIVNYKNLYNQLTVNSNYDYYELYRQPLYITDFTGDSSLTEAQINNVSTIQSIQISKNVQDDFEIEPSSGTLLQIDDFIHEPNEIIPILIGANFKGTYEIEDIFSAEYLFFDYDFIVVGTLKSGSNIKIGSDYICLDNYIVIQSFDYVGTPSTKNEYVSTKIHYK